MGSVKCNKATATEADRAARETRRQSVTVCLSAVMLMVCVCVGEGRWEANYKVVLFIQCNKY